MRRLVVFQWLLLLLVFVVMITTGARAPNYKSGRRTLAGSLSPVDPLLKESYRDSTAIPSDVEKYFYHQTLDHFNYVPGSYATFEQRYFINYKWWGGPNKTAPILVYFGAEGPIDEDIINLGFFAETAQQLNALIIYLEHRFYGESNPYGTNGDPNSVEAIAHSVNDTSMRGYFNSAQALADYAELLLHIKDELRAYDSPIIVAGGSYGGMLASWFRLKYPHIAMGALASSAPILYFDDITPQDGYYSVVTKDFQERSENCYNTIKKSWDEIDRVASMPNGLAFLTQKFRFCSPLNNSYELKDYLDSMYTSTAQYDSPPNYPTAKICQGIDGASNISKNNILDRIFAGIVAYQPNQTCYMTTQTQTQSSIGWRWQACSEMVMPIGITSDGSMFPKSPYESEQVIEMCTTKYGVAPRPHWATTYYGGHDIRLVLNRYASNIIFSNGLRDPYSSAGVLEDISDSILSVKTTEGSHCLDLVSSKETDPDWLVQQRNDEVKILQTWLKIYYQNLKQ